MMKKLLVRLGCLVVAFVFYASLIYALSWLSCMAMNAHMTFGQRCQLCFGEWP